MSESGRGEAPAIADIMASIRRMVAEAPAAPEAPPAPETPPPAAAAVERAPASEPKAEASPAPALTVEQLVREALEPALRDWLDRHLHDIVEEVVTREVRRVTRRE